MSGSRFGSQAVSAGAALLVMTTAAPLVTALSKDRETGHFPYNPTVVVLLVDVLKLVVAFLLFFYTTGFTGVLRHSGFTSWGPLLRQSLYFSVPALLYAISNNLDLKAQELLGASDYALLTNLKILSTALLSRLFLATPLSAIQWLSLVVLTTGAGVSTLHVEVHEGAEPDVQEDSQAHGRLLGLVIILFQVTVSSSAGVWTEYVMKGRGVVKDQHTQLQNFQLYAYGIPVDLIVILSGVNGTTADWNAPLAGFRMSTWLVVINNAAYGFAVSYVMKYADNIIKSFISCMAIVTVGIISTWLFGTSLHVPWLFSAILISTSVALYQLGKEPPATLPQKLQDGKGSESENVK